MEPIRYSFAAMIASAPGSVKVSSFRFVPNDGVGGASWQSRTLPTISLHRQKRQASRRPEAARCPPAPFPFYCNTKNATLQVCHVAFLCDFVTVDSSFFTMSVTRFLRPSQHRLRPLPPFFCCGCSAHIRWESARCFS